MKRDDLRDKLRLTDPASRCEQIQIVIGVRWTVESGVVLHRVRAEHDTVAEEEAKPHEDVAGGEFADEDKTEAEAAKQDEHHRVEEAEREREDVLVKGGGYEEHGKGRQHLVARHHDLVHVFVDVRVEPVVHHHVPRAIIRTIGCGIPPILQPTNSLYKLQTEVHFLQ